MEYTGVLCYVYTCSDSDKSLMQVSVNEAVSAYDHPARKTCKVVLSQDLYLVENQEPCLLCPNKK